MRAVTLLGEGTGLVPLIAVVSLGLWRGRRPWAVVAGPAAWIATWSATALVESALVGAVVVLLADFAALHLLPASPMPTGIVTGLVGGPFLIWLLVAAPRRGRTR